MKYIYTETPIEAAANDLAKTLVSHLNNKEKVLWLLSGGSSIPIAIQASQQLKGRDLSNLIVSLTDERYGDVGHSEENWQQLIDGGLDLGGATVYRPLVGKDIIKTTELFNDWLAKQFATVNYAIGIFGMGSDGHTAGIKPHSPAVKSVNLASSFTSDDFRRITINFVAIAKIDEAVIQASGTNKKQILHDLLYYEVPIEDQPAQILKTIPNATIYTNNPKEEL